jgi:hypothetical protein
MHRLGAAVSAALLTIVAPAAPIPHPGGSTALLLHVSVVAPAGQRGGPSVTIRGDGSTVLQPRVGGPGHASPEPLVFRISEAGVQRVLRAARRAGLLQPTSYGRTRFTDHRVTVVEIRADHQHRVVRVEALALTAYDAGVSGRQRAAREALRFFVRRVTSPVFYASVLVGR